MIDGPIFSPIKMGRPHRAALFRPRTVVQWRALVAVSVGLVLSRSGLGAVVTTALDELDPVTTPPSATSTGLSLREAMLQSPSGEVITFDPVVFGGPTPTIVLNPNLGEIEPHISLTIDASALAGPLTISAAGGTHRHLLVMPNLTVILRHLRFIQGHAGGRLANGNGGALLNLGNLKLERCVLTQNSSSQYGGAIINYAQFGNAELTIEDTIITGNSSGDHCGAIFNWAQAFEAKLIVKRSTISQNTAAVPVRAAAGARHRRCHGPLCEFDYCSEYSGPRRGGDELLPGDRARSQFGDGSCVPRSQSSSPGHRLRRRHLELRDERSYLA
jgi:hypothetical protein